VLEETMQSTDDPLGIDVEPVTAWFEANVEEASGPLRFDLITGGRSNLTFRVTDAAGYRYVLRRPPLGHVLATAHDMGREHRIISALAPTSIPVPKPRGLCLEEAVNGAPFYVMDFIDGVVVVDQGAAEAALGAAARRHAGESVADALSDLHAVDVEAVGLHDLSKHDGYVARQLKRWYAQFQASNESTGRPVPAMHELHERLAARIPEQQGVAIVHGDFRLDNCMVDTAGRVVAVLDWELCTLGDPLADLGLLLVYWTDAADPEPALLVAPTLAEGFPSKADIVERYATRSRLDLSQLDFYVALGFWKLAAILEGVYSRYAAGAMGTSEEGFEAYPQLVVRLAERGCEAADRLTGR
jgi:aminoglycoside phosphotransferase (APT) family kinase protein